MSVIIKVGCKYFISKLFFWGIYVYRVMIGKKVSISEFMQVRKHGSVSHIMAVDDRIIIGKIFGIYMFRIDTSGIALYTINGIVQLVGVVGFVL